jgi:GH18 family chitinase
MDSIVTNVVNRFKDRAETGFNKYGTDMDRKDLNIQEWIQHLQDELHDAYLYSEKLKVEHSLAQADEIKTLMNEWIAELNLSGISMTSEMCVASFYAYLLRKNQ